MEDIRDRLARNESLLQVQSNAIGRLQGQLGIIIGLQLAQVSALVAVAVKVFGG